MTNKTLIIANWKMNLNIHEASLYLHKLSDKIPVHRDVELVIAPTTLTLQSLSLQANHRQFKLAAQNFYWRDHGAYTGEVSATQLRGVVQYALVGHSERRNVFNESDKDVRAKVQAAIRNHIIPVLCIGETASERANNETHDILHDQLVGGLANVTAEDLSNVVIAYEPVWAIGTGNNVKPSDLASAVKAIRSQINHLYGKAASKEIRILDGGSVTADNAADCLAVNGINGLLVGGASLNLYEFAAIADAAHKKAGKSK